jgi:hypothetical protein
VLDLNLQVAGVCPKTSQGRKIAARDGKYYIAWTIRERKENEIKLCWSGTKRTVGALCGLAGGIRFTLTPNVFSRE